MLGRASNPAAAADSSARTPGGADPAMLRNVRLESCPKIEAAQLQRCSCLSLPV